MKDLFSKVEEDKQKIFLLGQQSEVKFSQHATVQTDAQPDRINVETQTDEPFRDSSASDGSNQVNKLEIKKTFSKQMNEDS